jgi:hypothetical protein
LDVRGKRSKVRLWTLAERGARETEISAERTAALRRA